MPLLPTSKNEFEEDGLLIAERSDVEECLKRMGNSTEFSILKYIYSNRHKCLFCIIGHNKQIIIGKLADKMDIPVDDGYLSKLQKDYKAVFSQDGHNTERQVEELADSPLLYIWHALFGLFIEPVIKRFKDGSFRDILTTFKAETLCENIFFNIPLIYDLSFRFSKRTNNTSIYFSNVHRNTTLEHFEDLKKSGFPDKRKMYIMDGYKREYNQYANNPSIPESHLKLLLLRETLLEQIFNHFQEGGAKLIHLKQLKDWDEPISKENDLNFILLLSHFHNNQLLLPGASFINFDDLLKYVEKKQTAGTLKDNIILDATTCNNFKAFRKLREKGIAYIQMSMNNLSVDLSVYVLNELCFGKIANELGWEFPYLNGKRRLHTIYSDINRAFYVKMKLEHKIDI